MLRIGAACPSDPDREPAPRSANLDRRNPVRRLMDGPHGRPPRDHNRVEPGDAIGVAIRMPKDRAPIVAELLTPALSSEWILALPAAITLYATVGHDLVNGRPAS